MPIPLGPEETKKREEARIARETARLIEEEQKYTKVIDDQIDAIKKAGVVTADQAKEIVRLTKLKVDLKKATETDTKALQDNIEEMDRANTVMAKSIKLYKDASDWMTKMSANMKPLLQDYNEYHLEVQKIVDLSGKFIGKFKEGANAFEKLRTAINLTTKETAEFGKIWTKAGQQGINLDKFEATVKHLQSIRGHKGGLEAIKDIMEIQVPPDVLRGVVERNQMAIAKAMRTADAKQMWALSAAAATGPAGIRSGEAARFKVTEARMEKIREDVQMYMAEGVQSGLTPEIAAMVGPLTEMNQTLRKIYEENSGIIGWVKTLLGGGGSAAAGATAAGGGARLMGLGRVALGGGRAAMGGTALGFMAASYGMDYAAEGMTEENEPWTGAKSHLTSGAKAGRVGAAALGGATVGSIAGPPGTAVGAVVAGTLAAAQEYPELVNKRSVGKAVGTAAASALPGPFGMVASAGATAMNATGYMDQIADYYKSWFEETFKKAEEPVNEFSDIINKVNSLTASLEEQMKATAESIGKTPEMLAKQIAQSRLPIALESMDPKPMQDYMEVASKAFDVNMKETHKIWMEQMNKLDAGIDDIMKKAAAARAGGDEGKAAAIEQQAERLRAEKLIATARVQEQMGKEDLAAAAEAAMQGYTSRKGMRGLETQAAQVGFETQFGGTGNVAEMQKLQDQMTATYQANVVDLDEQNAVAKEKLIKQRDLWQKDIDEGLVKDSALKTAEDNVRKMNNKLAQMDRTTDLEKRQLTQADQQARLVTLLNKTMAATETVEFKVAERREALLKGQQAMALEMGAAPEVVGGFARRQAGEAEAQLDLFMKEYDIKKQGLEAEKAIAKNDVERMAIEMDIATLADERSKLELKTFQSRMNAATAEEKQRQEMIGAQKRIAEISQDTAAKLGMNWRVQMVYQQQMIELSRADVESTRAELGKVIEVIHKAQIDGEDIGQLNLTRLKLEGDLMQKQGALAEATIGKQRSFLDKAIAAGFGVGTGTKVSPVINNRMFGEMVQGAGGIKIQGFGGGPGFLQQQAMRMGGLQGVMGGIGGGVPAPGKKPGVPEGQAVPPKEGEVGFIGPPKPKDLLAQAPPPQEVDVRVKTEVVFSDPMFTEKVTTVMRNAKKPGGILAQNA